MPYNVPGLLDDDESLLPSAGLLSAFQAADPSQSALQQLGSQPAAQPPAPVTGAPPAAAPAAAAPKQQPKEVLSPTRSAIVAGGLQLLEDSSRPTAAPMTVGQMVASALRAGIPTLVASRQAKQSRADELQRQEQFKSMVTSSLKDGTLTPEQARQASQMGADAGIKYLENLSMEGVKSKAAIDLEKQRQLDPKVVGKSLVGPGGKQVFRDSDPSMTVDGNVYKLGADGLPAKDEQGNTLPPLIKKDTPFDINSIDSETRGAIQVALGRDPRNPTAFGAPLTEEDVKKVTAYNLTQRNASSAKNSTTIMNDTAGAAAAKGVIESLTTARTDADNAANDLTVIDRARNSLTRGFPTGPGAKAKLGLASAARLLGFGSGKGIDNAGIYMTQIAERVLPIARTLAPVTEEDIALLTKVKGGDFSSMSAEGLRKLLDLGAQANEQRIDSYNERAKGSTVLPEAARHDFLVPFPKGYKRLTGGTESEDERIKRLAGGG